MSEPFYDVLVVGAGPIGSAAARHLVDQGATVAVIGPEEPADHTDHDGTWAGHYDQGRLAHALEVPLATSLLAMRSVRRFEELRRRTGVRFTTPTHSLVVMPEVMTDDRGANWFDRGVLKANAADLGVEVEDLDEAALRRNYPGIVLERGHVGLVQRDALILDPRSLVRAELVAATASGAHLVRDEVCSLDPTSDGVRATGRGGGAWQASQVVVATGAASNTTGLLPRPLVMPTFGATVVLVEVEPGSVDLPTMMYLKRRDGDLVFGGIVMAPVEYPDGRHYLKVAGNSLLDNPLDTRSDIAAWVRTGGRAEDADTARSLLAELIPDLSSGAVYTRPCLVCATPTERPYLDRVDDRTVVAVEGERGAMSADEIGRLAAGLTLSGHWSDPLPAELFRAEWGEPGWTTTSHLASSR